MQISDAIVLGLVAVTAVLYLTERRRHRTRPRPVAVRPGRHSDRAVLITLPALGEDVTEGTVLRWLKQVGDPVRAGEPLLEVSTDKVDTEIPASAAGTLHEITVAAGGTAPVGGVLAVIEP